MAGGCIFPNICLFHMFDILIFNHHKLKIQTHSQSDGFIFVSIQYGKFKLLKGHYNIF